MNYSSTPSAQKSSFLDNHSLHSISEHTIQAVFAFLLALTLAWASKSRHACLYGIICAIWFIWLRQDKVRTPSDLLQRIAMSFLVIVMALIASQTSKSSDMKYEKVQRSGTVESPQLHSPDIEDSLTTLSFYKPMVFPARTSHRRLHPTTHAFEYSYLLVGIPITHGTFDVDKMLSDSSQSAWFSVHAEDYLQRGPAFQSFSLRTKLDLYLQSQGVVDPTKAYPHAYLVTAPRFLGFSFNPVSFWFLYDDAQDLRAMILEVNNTFDERRMYYMGLDADTAHGDISSASMATGQAKRFSYGWNKDFHVSPFNDRDGIYSVKATDVCRSGLMDLTIVLSDMPMPSTNPAPKIVARVFSPSNVQKCDPTTLSFLEKTVFLLRYGWIGFLTNPRILIEARKLWTKGLTVYFRPEPFNTTIPRVESDQETAVEEHFHKFLVSLAQKSQVRIDYTPAAGLRRGQTTPLLPEGKNSDNITRDATLSIHILTPAFYSELVRIPAGNDNLLDAFDRLCFNPQPKEATLQCSSPTILRKAIHTTLLATGTPPQEVIRHKESSEPSSSYHEGLQIRVLHRLIDWLRTSRKQQHIDTQRVQPPTSEFDQQVSVTSDLSGYKTYLYTVLMILMADKLALGNMTLLRFQVGVLRVLAVCGFTVKIISVVAEMFHDRGLVGRGVTG